MDSSKDLHYQANSGQRTYVRNVNERKKSYNSLLKKYKQRNNSVTCTFKPSINPNSKFLLDEKSYHSLEREIARINRSNHGSFTCRNLHDSSLSRDRLLDRSKEEYIKIKKKLEKRDCTFKPRLNKVSQELAAKRKESLSSQRSNSDSKTKDEVFTKLYTDSLEHSKRIETLAQKLMKKQCPTKPTLGSSKSTKPKDFEESKKKYLRMLEKHRREHCKSGLNIEKKTSQKLFIPSIGKSRSNTRSRSRSNGKSVHENLYQDSKVRQQRKVDDK